MRLRYWILIIGLLLPQPCVLAQAKDTETILIRNVRLIDREGQDEDLVVSILIKNKKLDVVTKDKIPASEATVVVDAQNGVLLGKLDPFGGPEFSGYHVTASWALSGEMRSYNKRAGIFGQLPVSKSVYEGGWGAWEAAIRVSVRNDRFDR